ncbi:TetR/AcrR family transcriptional regulator [Vagococcus carniphilus]|uniref:TetR/AcrR family transcriptional regulator n=1 Tax=Vagococcus carniphilus TaxID=218144 RepID=UPI003B58EE39
MEEKQIEILKIATEEFATNGFYQTKTDIIAEKANVSKGLVFHYFKTKKNLYSETIREAIVQLEKAMNEGEYPTNSLIDLFDYSLKKKFELAKSHQFEMQLILDVYSHLEQLPEEMNQEIDDYLERVNKASYEMVATIVRRLPLKNGIFEEDVVKLVLMIFNQIELDAKKTMEHEIVTNLRFFDQVMFDARKQLSILETGFLRENRNFSR